ncbi:MULTISPECIES: FadR/GntR family transcriptional regulator [unclassified Streptomyces]|uniref:FadR/GntR family transcriptional regulator n=1 Tax=unclassified Streptomyces TaxID=2593676 RepID=UPI00110F92F3|nr:GntR family transcriptional regulator [Streptomyces sp. DASNCL29]TMU98158.1 FadR family transcriptional regulator [Streptomyces sp. DASNCL29]
MNQAARAAKDDVHSAEVGRSHVGRQVRVPKTAELIARSLRRQIIRGELAPDDALPSESSLMEQFGVSRPTLREAYRVLESEGLITVRRGARGGARVSAPDADVAARYAGLILEYRDATLADVYRAASIVEPPCAQIVADKHSETDIARLRKALTAEEKVLDAPVALVDAQEAFHSLVVELSGNQTIILLSGMLRHIIKKANSSYIAADPESAVRRTASRKGHRTHAKLLTLIEDGNGEEAEKLWSRHLTAADDAVNAAGAKTVLDLLG